MQKSQREHELCRGTARSTDCGRKYWVAWELGELGAAAPPEPVLSPPDFCDEARALPLAPGRAPVRGLGDLIANGIKAATFGLVKPCGGCQKRAAFLNRVFPFAYKPGDPPEFVTTARLMEDVRQLVSGLPPNTSEIIGIARSGVCVAGMVAMLMHRPLLIFRQSTGDLVPAGNGWRLTGNTSCDGPAVVIDDTVMTGNSFKHSLPIIRKDRPTALAAAVYVNPAARVKPDIWARDLPWPHLLEWNLFNSIMTPSIAVDFDGILCRDCPPESDDDGQRYLEFLQHAPPQYYVRRVHIPLIVTARLEKYRPQTMDWLARNGMAVDRLVMGPWQDNHERQRADVAAFKAEHFDRFRKQSHKIQPPMFIESDARLAQRIAELTPGGVVVCPAAGRCFKS